MNWNIGLNSILINSIVFYCIWPETIWDRIKSKKMCHFANATEIRSESNTSKIEGSDLLRSNFHWGSSESKEKFSRGRIESIIARDRITSARVIGSTFLHSSSLRLGQRWLAPQGSESDEGCNIRRVGSSTPKRPSFWRFGQADNKRENAASLSRML